MIDASKLMEAPKWHTREDLPRILNELGLLGAGAEIGVQLAQFHSRIRAGWKGRRIIGVDPWREYYGVDMTNHGHEDYLQRARQEMSQFPADSWVFMRMTSLEAAKVLAETRVQLDWVFLDGDHDYQPVLDDIDAYWPLVKPGGILAGHDWVVDGWHYNGQPFEAHPARPANNQCGPFAVRKAVAERFPAECVSVTAPETDLGWQSWLVRKAL